MNIRKGIRLTLLVILLVVAQVSLTAAAPTWCNCVQYMQKVYGIPTGGGAAANYGPTLIKNGYRQLSTPVAGAVIIFAAGAYGAGSDGHMGYIKYVGFDQTTGEVIIVVYHANWWGSGVSVTNEYCNNVKATTFRVRSYSGLSFYKK
jgi:hypothetical protein